MFDPGARNALSSATPFASFAANLWARRARAGLRRRSLDAGLLPGSGRFARGLPRREGACCWNEPRLFRRLLEKIARATAAYLKAQIAAGATAVQLFDTWAGELDAADYREFELPATQLLIEELAAGDTPVILFSKASNHLLGFSWRKPARTC